MHAGSWRMMASSIERKRSASLSISCRCCLAARRRCSITMAHQRRRGTRNRTQKATVIYCMASRLGFGASDGQAALKLSVAPIVPFVRLVSHKVTVAVLVVADIVIVMVAATTAAPSAYLYVLVPTAARFLSGGGISQQGREPPCEETAEEPSFRKKTADGARGGWAVPGRLGYGHMGYHGDTYRKICCSGFEATRPPCDGYLLFLTPSPGHGHARTSYTYRFSRAIVITM